MNGQRNLPFVRVRFNPTTFFQDFSDVVKIRSRFTSFFRCLGQFGILVVPQGCHFQRLSCSLPANLSLSPRVENDLERFCDALRDGYIRYLELPPAEITQIAEVDLAAWEDSPLGDPWRACIVQEGAEVVSLLADAFQCNERVVVLDPALGGFVQPRAKPARKELLRLCKTHRVKSLEVYSEFGLRDRDEETALSVPPIIRGEINNFSWEGFRPSIKWYVKQHEGNFHDRFVGFAQRTLPESPYQAATIGGGLLALKALKKRGKSIVRYTAVARIPEAAFLSALDAVEELEGWIEAVDI
jgi:hypothetical protein